MADDAKSRKKVEDVVSSDPFYRSGDVVGLSISSVVDKKCRKLGIDYRAVMIRFIELITGRGFRVLIIANGARIHSDKPRNNDLMICDAVYEGVRNKEMVRWYHEEMDAEEIREFIGRCRFLVASRFHAMIGALEKRVPVLLIGWSHKYQEVLDFFELGQYAIDFSELTADSLIAEFDRFVSAEEEIHKKIDAHYDEVMESSRKNIAYVREVLDSLPEKKK